MRSYLFGTGIIGAVTTGMSLFKGTRGQSFTWRTALAWASWLITLALAIGTINDVRRDRRGIAPLPDEPEGEAKKILKKIR